MKSLFDNATTDELIKRINTLDENSKALWGKMSIYQMLEHCTLWEEMMAGKKKYKRMLIGRLFGKMALRRMLKDDSPIARNSPTVPGFKIEETNGDVLAEKAKWIAMISEHVNFLQSDFVHPFFGKMTKEQLGYFAYKNINHHLRQFNS